MIDSNGGTVLPDTHIISQACMHCLITFATAHGHPTQLEHNTHAELKSPDYENSTRVPRNEAEQRAMQRELPSPRGYNKAPSTQGHFGSPKQASTWLSGPEPGDLSIEILDLENSFRKHIGTSPWHIVSTRRYAETQDTTIWGATLTDVYRVTVGQDRFVATDLFVANRFPISLPWNLFAADNGRVFVPDTNGRQMTPGRTSGPTLLVIGDDPEGTGHIDQGIALIQAVELDRAALRAACSPPRGARLIVGPTGSNFRPGFNGEIVTEAVYELRDGSTVSYLIALDDEFSILAAGEIGPTSSSNDFPAEPDGPGRTAFYIPTDLAIVKMIYDSEQRVVERRWSAELPVRERLGTTPTLMNTPDGERLVVVVDAKAAVVAGLNGLIAYSNDRRPGALIAVRRDDDIKGMPRVITTTLPNWMGAVENSPAVRGGIVVVTNYSGYLPNGLAVPAGGNAPATKAASWGESPDAKPEFATGLIALRYNPEGDSFETLWQRKNIQYSGVPTISESSNIVYGTGSEKESGMTYFYGMQLLDDEQGVGGEIVIREELGIAPFRTSRKDLRGNVGFTRSEYRLAEGEFFDAGNNLLILEDGSAIVNGGRALARIRNRFDKRP